MGSSRPLLAALLVVALVTRLALCADASATSPVPEFEVVLEGAFTTTGHITPSPDLRHVYVTRKNIPSLNVYQVAASRWRELSLILVVPICLLLVRRVKRLWRMRTLPGVPYCGRCGYALLRITSDRCPECGTALLPRNRRIGRPIHGRMASALLPLALLAGTWTWLEMRLPPQYTNWTGPVRYSDSLAEFASRRKLDWLTRYQVLTTVVDQHDPRTGQVLRRMCQLPSEQITNPGAAVSISRDSTRVFVVRSGVIEEYEASTGLLVHTYAGSSENFDSCWEAEDGSLNSYVSYHRGLLCWNRGSFEPPSFRRLHTVPRRSRVVCRLVSGDHVLLHLRRASKPYFTLTDPNGKVREFGESISEYIWAISQDGTKFYATPQRSACISGGLPTESALLIYDLPTGRLVAERSFPFRIELMELTPDGTGLLDISDGGDFLPSNTRELHDIQTGRAIRRIVFSGVAELHRYWISPDGCRALVVGTDPTTCARVVQLVNLGDALKVPGSPVSQK